MHHGFNVNRVSFFFHPALILEVHQNYIVTVLAFLRCSNDNFRKSQRYFGERSDEQQVLIVFFSVCLQGFISLLYICAREDLLIRAILIQHNFCFELPCTSYKNRFINRVEINNSNTGGGILKSFKSPPIDGSPRI